MTIHRPHWFSDEFVLVSTAPTCGLTKGGRTLKKVDPLTAKRVQVLDEETGQYVDAVNDQLLSDVEALAKFKGIPGPEATGLTETTLFVPAKDVNLSCAVPTYHDRRYHKHFTEALEAPEYTGFGSATLGDLLREEQIIIRGGHGSPSQEQRIGEVPYIKVSDLRAGLVNINPTNRVPRSIAEKFWKGPSSGLQAYDLVCPERTSKNIGDFCMLMPGQEQVLMTKEIIVIRPGPKAHFDAFYLLWAMTLKIVRDQWKRVVFMQTNREDVGKRYYEIEIPVPKDGETAAKVSAEFKRYYESLAGARTQLQTYLRSSTGHHFFVSGAEDDIELLVEVEAELGDEPPKA